MDGLMSNGGPDPSLFLTRGDITTVSGGLDAEFFDSLISGSDSFGGLFPKAPQTFPISPLAQMVTSGAQPPLQAPAFQSPGAQLASEGPPFDVSGFQAFLDQSFQQASPQPDLPDTALQRGQGHGRSSGSSGEVEAPMQQPALHPPLAGSGGSDLDAKLLDQLTRMKDKNRKAQKRYRDKQKSKLAETESRVEELMRQVSQLQLEKQSLASRNSLLEKYMAMKEEEQSSTALAAPQRGEGGGLADTWWLDGPTKRLMEQSLNLSGVLTFTVHPAHPLRMTREMVAELPVEKFSELWREYINQIAQCLLEANNDPTSPAATRLAELNYEAGLLKLSRFTDQPAKLWAFKAGGASVLTPDAEPLTREAWRQLARGLNLTPMQMHYVLQMRRMYLHSLSDLVQRRRELSEALQVAVPMTSADPAPGAELPTARYMKTIDMLEELRDVLRKEHSLTIQFMMTIWRRILTTFQSSQLHVQSYPWSANTLEIVNLLAEDAGEPTADQLLAGDGAGCSSISGGSSGSGDGGSASTALALPLPNCLDVPPWDRTFRLGIDSKLVANPD